MPVLDEQALGGVHQGTHDELTVALGRRLDRINVSAL
jgi:hypothetical protein